MNVPLEIIGLILNSLIIPALVAIFNYLRKNHRANRLNGYKISALIFALQQIEGNGFTAYYDKKLNDLIKDSNFVEDK